MMMPPAFWALYLESFRKRYGHTAPTAMGVITGKVQTAATAEMA